MLFFGTVKRGGGTLTTSIAVIALALTGTLSGCATSQKSFDYSPPKMAPEQSIDEACELTGKEVDRLTLETEAQIKVGIEQAVTDIGAGKMPAFDFFPLSISEVLGDVQAQVVNPEVSQALTALRESYEGFGKIDKPKSLFEAAGYVSSITTQLKDLAVAGQNLQSLCGTTPVKSGE